MSRTLISRATGNSNFLPVPTTLERLTFDLSARLEYPLSARAEKNFSVIDSAVRNFEETLPSMLFPFLLNLILLIFVQVLSTRVDCRFYVKWLKYLKIVSRLGVCDG